MNNIFVLLYEYSTKMSKPTLFYELRYMDYVHDISCCQCWEGLKIIVYKLLYLKCNILVTLLK